jgi:hypothetical protein
MISYNITVAATYSLLVQARGDTVTYGTSNVTISPAEVDPASCVAFGTGLASEGLVVGNVNAFVVQLRDRFLNNITAPEASLEVLISDVHSSFAVYLFLFVPPTFHAANFIYLLFVF